MSLRHIFDDPTRTAAAIDAMLVASRAYRTEQKARGRTRDRRVELRLMLEAAAEME
jgi:hypothetical protein